MTGVQTCALPICFPVTIIGHVIEAIFSQKAGVTVTGLGTLSPEMGASVALSSTSVDTCEDMDVTEDMEDIIGTEGEVGVGITDALAASLEQQHSSATKRE